MVWWEKKALNTVGVITKQNKSQKTYVISRKKCIALAIFLISWIGGNY